MIDYLTLALTHGLIAIALWRLLWRDELDDDSAAPVDAIAGDRAETGVRSSGTPRRRRGGNNA